MRPIHCQFNKWKYQMSINIKNKKIVFKQEELFKNDLLSNPYIRFLF